MINFYRPKILFLRRAVSDADVDDKGWVRVLLVGDDHILRARYVDSESYAVGYGQFPCRALGASMTRFFPGSGPRGLVLPVVRPGVRPGVGNSR